MNKNFRVIRVVSKNFFGDTVRTYDDAEKFVKMYGGNCALWKTNQ